MSHLLTEDEFQDIAAKDQAKIAQANKKVFLNKCKSYQLCNISPSIDLSTSIIMNFEKRRAVIC